MQDILYTPYTEHAPLPEQDNAVIVVKGFRLCLWELRHSVINTDIGVPQLQPT